jgi:hypothetical protein
MTASQESRFQVSVFHNDARESNPRDGTHQIGVCVELVFLLARSIRAPSRQHLSDSSTSYSYRIHVGSNILHRYNDFRATRSDLCIGICLPPL